MDSGPENSRRLRVRKESHPANSNRKALYANIAESFPHRIRARYFAEKLQSYVIGAAAHEAHSGQAGLKRANVIVQPLLDRFVDVQCNKKAHGFYRSWFP